MSLLGYKTCNWCGYEFTPVSESLCYSCDKEFTVIPQLTPTTQKAKGIYTLAKNLQNMIGWFSGMSAAQPIGLFKVSEEIPPGIEKHLPAFCRPCPPSPEHGFVESRDISDLEGLEALRKETLAANPLSEILLMKKIAAEWNVVWTPSMITIGPGHDGATSGKGCFSIPLAGINPIGKDYLTMAGVTPGKDPYIEAVISQGYIYLTQLRSGPKLEGVGLDFIPETVNVSSVVKTNGEDLLEWAKKVKVLKADNAALAEAKMAAVVYHPGGSLTDHYSVHCRENGVPILISFEPKVGQLLEKSSSIAPPDPEAMKLGVAVGSLASLLHYRSEAVNLLLLALHNSPALRGPYSFWIGVAASIMLKLGSAALRGEARHAHNATSKVRGDVYNHYTPKSITFHRAGLSRVTQILTYGFGEPAATHSFGGKKWGLCGAALAPLFNAVRELFQNPSPDSASNLTQALNLAVNQAHNGGWWLNKFASHSAYTEIPKGHLGWVLSVTKVAPSLWALREKAEEGLEKFSKEIQSWPETSIGHLKWREVSMDVTPGAFILNLKAATVPTAQQITVPVTPAMIKSLLSASAKVELQDGKVLFITPGGEKYQIWEEEALVPENVRP